MTKLKLSVLLSVLFLLLGFNTNAQDAKTILNKMDDVMYSPKDMMGETKIVITDKKGKTKIREANIIQK